MKNAHKWLVEKAEQLIRDCREETADGVPFYPPNRSGGYSNAMYLRDFEYMVESCPRAIPPEEIKRIYLSFLGAQRKDGRIPNIIDKKDKAWFDCWGDAPCTDNEQFIVKLVYEYYRLTQDLSLFRETAPKLERGIRSLPRDPENGLVWVDPEKPHAAYGFTDTICKTGDELFSSLLLYEALTKLSELYELAGLKKEAKRNTEGAESIKQSIQAFWVPAEGLFHAASLTCNQPDIWGSAYAVYIGLASHEQSMQISTFFADNYAKIVKRGQVRHIIEGTSWEKLIADDPEIAAPGRFQNGGYWGTPVGWVSFALRLTSPALAERIYDEMITDYQTNGVYECIGDNYTRIKDYVVSAALPAKEIERDK